MLGEFPSLSETFVLNQITALIDRGHDVSIFAERQSNEATTHADVARYDLRRRTRYEAMPRSFWGRLRVLASPWRLRRAERRALNVFRFGRDALSLRLLWAARMVGSDANFDIIQCHFGALGRKAALLRQAGALRGCIVTAFHGADIISYPKRLGSDVYKPLFVEGDLFLPISDRWHDSLHSLGCPMERVRVHRMGVDTSEFSPRGPTSDAEAPIQILSVSRLVEKKGIGDAILAVARLRIGYTYQIVGDGPLRSVLGEHVEDQLREDEVEAEDEARHHHDRHQHDDRVGDELSSRGPVDLAKLLADLLQELPSTGALLLPLGRCARSPTDRGRGGLAPFGDGAFRAPLLALLHPLHLPVHGSPLQGRRDLNPQPSVLETGALPN